MNLKDYLSQNEKTYRFRIKTIFELDAEDMGLVESCLNRFRPKTVERPKKMMFQTAPLGFVGVKNVEVYYIDIELTVPPIVADLEHELRADLGLGIEDTSLQVFGENDPRMLEPVANKPRDKAMLEDNDYSEDGTNDVDKDLVGEGRKKNLLAYLKDVAAKRENNPGKVDIKDGDPAQVEGDFNKDIPVAKAKWSTIKVAASKAGPVQKK